MAVLDSFVNPDFPFYTQGPEEKAAKVKEKWSELGCKIPLRYHFYFYLLDGDGDGRPARTKNGAEVKDFKSYSASAFQLIADYADSAGEQVFTLYLMIGAAI